MFGTRVAAEPRSPRGLVDLSRHNRALILRTLRDVGPLARSVLATATGLSKAATSKMVDSLLADGRLTELETENPARLRGRRIGLNPGFAHVVGLELTNDGPIRGVVVDTTGDVLDTVDGRFDAAAGPEAAADALAASVRQALSASEAGAARVRAVGVAVPGTVDAAGGVARWLPTARNWFDVPLQTLMEGRTTLPTTVDWRAYTATLAELRYGCGQRREHVVCLYLGEGIGMGVGWHGTLWRGAGDQAGSVAHLRVAADGPVCHCGMRGCFWAVASVPAILHRVEDAVRAGALSTVVADGRPVTLPGVLAAARAGDRLTVGILEEVATHVGHALAASFHLLNPELAVVTGPLSEAADVLAATVERVVQRSTFPWLRPPPAVRFSQLGLYAAARGAATLALDRVLDLH